MRKLHCKLASLIDAYNLKVSETGTGQRLSQRSLASRTGVAVSTIHRLYKNSARRFDADVLEKICNELECELGQLLVLQDEVSA